MNEVETKNDRNSQVFAFRTPILVVAETLTALTCYKDGYIMVNKSFSKPKEVLLLGGGHSNLQVLHQLARIDPSLFNLTLISDVLCAPYSGMIPSYLAGVYSEAELHFDLQKICDRFSFKFIEDKVTFIDSLRNQIHTATGKIIGYDICSINLGILPTLIPATQGPQKDIIYLKPISKLIERWKQTSQLAGASANGLSFTVIGGGAGAFEVAIACRRKFRSLDNKIRMIAGKGGLLPEYNRTAQKYARQSLKDLNIDLLEGVRVEHIESTSLLLDDTRHLDKQICFVGTSAQAPEVFRHSGLPVSKDGFVTVDENLLVSGLKNIFAAGDCCFFLPRPLPKAGVFAVRQGPVLAANITALILNQSALTKYFPQSPFLTILVSGDNKAIAAYKNFVFQGRWAWRLKDYIDRKFMKRFQ